MTEPEPEEPWNLVASWPCTADELRATLMAKLADSMDELRDELEAQDVPTDVIERVIQSARAVALDRIEADIPRMLEAMEATSDKPRDTARGSLLVH